MIKLQNVSISVDKDITDAKLTVSDLLKLSPKKIKTAYIFRRSVDVRRKNEPKFCYTFVVDFFDKSVEKSVLAKNKNAVIYKREEYIFKKAARNPKLKPVIVGSGPAGLFAAITLCKAGISPIIIERGKPLNQRLEDIENFRKNHILNTESNIQFGEGGAGTFSDGKLNTGTKDDRIRTVLEIFAKFGADPDILVNAKPHIGTDVLQNVIKNIREYIISCGGEYYFETKFEKPVLSDGKISEIICTKGGKSFNIACENLILAIGNSARDTFSNLAESNISLIAKPFAIGLRIEHLQERLNVSQYGENYNKKLPPNEYKLAVHLKNGRGVYTFCMCPGGYVVNGASEPESIVTNGMSYHARNGKNANSAILVGVTPDDFGNNPLDGISLQREIERKAFNITGGYFAPCQTVGSLLYGEENTVKEVKPTVLPEAKTADLSKIFPDYIIDSIKEALPCFDKKIKGFADSSALLTGPETRSSSPVKIPRTDEFECNVKGIYPIGEGAGYAGGITSSAVDGIKAAEIIISKYL